MSRQQEFSANRLFGGFNGDEIDAFVEAADRKSLPTDHVFFRMGDINSSLFIICTGSVKIDRIGAADDIPLVDLGGGGTFKEMTFMDGSRTTGTVTATEPTDVLEISRESVSKLLDKKPDLAMKLWRNFALDLKQRLTKTNEVIDQYIDLNQVLLQDQTFRQYYSRL